MASTTLIFTFQELPLTIDKGFEAGLVNGQAEITYNSDVWSFCVSGLWLDGYKEVEYTEEQKMVAKLIDKDLPLFETKLVNVDAGSWLDTTICGRLYAEWSHKVHEAIREQLAEDRMSRLEAAE